MTKPEILSTLERWYSHNTNFTEMYAEAIQANASGIEQWIEVVAKIRDLLPGWSVGDYSDLNQFPSLGIEAIKACGLESELHVTGFVALIAPVAYCRAVIMHTGGEFPTFSEVTEPAEWSLTDTAENTMQCVLKEFGYSMISRDFARSRVPFPTECHPPGAAMPFHCLFAPHLSP